MSQNDLSWTLPVMRAGYAGRGLVYLVVAGFSLYAVWRGGQAQGTSSALSQLETTTWGGIILFLIFLGMFAYAIWRFIDSAYDLEDYGSDGEGAIARAGMITTGLVHGAIGVLAFTLLFSERSGGGSSIAEAVGTVMQLARRALDRRHRRPDRNRVGHLLPAQGLDREIPQAFARQRVHQRTGTGC